MCEVQAFSGWCPDVQEGGVEDLFLAGGLLASGPKRYGSKHGLREVVGEFHELDSEGTVSESAGWLASSHLRGCSEDTDEILVLVNMVYNRSSEGLLESALLSGHSSGGHSRKRCTSSRMVRTCSQYERLRQGG